MHWHLYVDMDAFYVSCELRDRPDLKGRPVIVGPNPREGATRGVVLSASYEARRFGVRSAMPVRRAFTLCPEATWLPADFEKYLRASHELRDLLLRHSPEAAMHSIDEASLPYEADDPSEVKRFAAELQAEVVETLHLPCSLGVSPFRSVAKIATDRAKPGGILVVPPEDTPAFLAPLPVGAIPGVGPKTSERLRELGFETIGALADGPLSPLRRRFGRFGDELRALAKGHPKEYDAEERGPRTRSSDRTGENDWTDRGLLLDAVESVARELAGSVKQETWRFRQVTVRFRWSDFNTGQRGHLLSGSTDSDSSLVTEARRLGGELWDEERGPPGRGVRTISVAVGRLSRRKGSQPTIDQFNPPRSPQV